ncbi:MurR/RpiR family transcriptional regulator [Oryzibacter oryziterrae]|uniref:MurR/RpiR family transcriptional regulator n=1 Tax=Oryzibacter oryziterrae TaxID=2766474 RepID=UPI001F3E915A|nr:MurR/RpiR family transcriptional regulator [Oryzibacter oryziterrae]
MADNSPSQPPRDFRSLRDLLVSSRDALPKRLAQVAAYAIESPDDIAFGTAASIAENAAVQPSTLVRFAKALGYQGFTELQSVFQERLRDRPSNYDDRLQSLVSHAAGPAVGAALIEGFSSAAIRSVEQMRARVDAATLEEACRLLADAETIYLIAQRRAFPITSYMSYAFGKLGIKTVLVGSGAGTDVETLSFAGPKDAAFAVSFTPYASATVDFARQVARQNVPLIVITDSPFSPLVPEKGVWFEVVEADFEGFRSLAATMSLALSLTVGTAEMRRTKPE